MPCSVPARIVLSGACTRLNTSRPSSPSLRCDQLRPPVRLTNTPPESLSFTTPTYTVAGCCASPTNEVISLAENPVFDGTKLSPPSSLASTPRRSVASSTRLEFVGSTYTSFTITSEPVVCIQYLPASNDRYKPCVVP